jgi:hypothetical protein
MAVLLLLRRRRWRRRSKIADRRLLVVGPTQVARRRRLQLVQRALRHAKPAVSGRKKQALSPVCQLKHPV